MDKPQVQQQQTAVDRLAAFLHDYPLLWLVYGIAVLLPLVAIVAYCWPKRDASGSAAARRKKTDESTPDDVRAVVAQEERLPPVGERVEEREVEGEESPEVQGREEEVEEEEEREEGREEERVEEREEERRVEEGEDITIERSVETLISHEHSEIVDARTLALTGSDDFKEEVKKGQHMHHDSESTPMQSLQTQESSHVERILSIGQDSSRNESPVEQDVSVVQVKCVHFDASDRRDEEEGGERVESIGPRDGAEEEMEGEGLEGMDGEGEGVEEYHRWSFPPQLDEFDLMETDVDPRELELIFEDERLIEVLLNATPDSPGLGISIVGGSGSPSGADLPVIIKRVLPNSLSEQDGRLKSGDELVAVNDKLLVGISKDYAINALSNLEGVVRLLVLQDD